MNLSKGKAYTLFFIVVGVLFSIQLFSHPFSTSQAPKGIQDIELLDLNGKKVKISDFKGKKVFINFWATWCRPCVMEMPSIERLKTALANDNYVFLTVSDEDIKTIENFKNQKNYSLTFLKAKSLDPAGIDAIPLTIVLDEAGKVRLSEVGSREWDKPEQIALLRNLPAAQE